MLTLSFKTQPKFIHTRGISMIEVLIGIAVMGSLLVFASKMITQTDEQNIGYKQADVVQSFLNVASQYVISNRSLLEEAMINGTNGANLCQVAGNNAFDTTLHTCAFDAQLLQSKSLWPENTTQAIPGEPVNLRLVAILRHPTTSSGIDMFIAFANSNHQAVPLPEDIGTLSNRNQAFLSSLGATAGAIPLSGNNGGCYDKVTGSISDKYACGNAWSLNLRNFISNAEYVLLN